VSRQARFLVIFLTLIPTFSSAQIRLGLHVGIRTSGFGAPERSSWPVRPNGGVSVEYSLTRTLKVAAQLDYVQHWIKMAGSPFGGFDIYSSTFKSEYVEIPLFLRWKPEGSTVRWYCDIGLAMSQPVSANLESFDGHGIVTSNVGGDLLNTYVSISIGFGAEIEVLNPIDLSIAAHYYNGLAEIIPQNQASRPLGLQMQLGLTSGI
jgi:Outer membrane protein beta-barrel domain